VPGDVLGVKQSGRFSDVGYHMFLSLVEDEILKEQGRYAEPVPRPAMTLGVSAFIPESYVSDSGERLALYNAIAEPRKKSWQPSLSGHLTDMAHCLQRSQESLR